MGSNSVCLKHHDREATNRCASCLKPICDECRVLADTSIFCSEDCRDKAAAHAARRAQTAPKPAPNPIGAILTWVGALVVVVVALYFAWPYLPARVKAPVLSILGQPAPTPKPHHK